MMMIKPDTHDRYKMDQENNYECKEENLKLFVLEKRSLKKYSYESLITGEIQDELPKEEEEEEEIEVLNDVAHIQERLNSEKNSFSSLTYSISEHTAPKSISSERITSGEPNLPEPVLPQLPSSQCLPLPPLPPLPPIDTSKLASSEIPPLPCEASSNGMGLQPNPPQPPPPEVLPYDANVEQLNTSTSQVEDMDLSDGDDDASGEEVHTNLGNVVIEENNSSNMTSEDQSRTATITKSASHKMPANIIFNNDPHMYQGYYQNCQQIFEGQVSKDLSKSVDETNDIPLQDALTSFYSDIASINNVSEDDCRAIQSNILSSASSTKSSSEHITANLTETLKPLQVFDAESSEQDIRLVSTVDTIRTLDDRSNSPRSLTPDRGIQDEREKRKKKAKLASGLSMKRKGVSNLVAKWQNIQEQSSKQRPQ